MGRPRSNPDDRRFPKYVYFKRGVYIFIDKSIGRTYIIGRTEKEAFENYARINGFRDPKLQASWAMDLIRTVKKNARTRNIPVEIDKEWILNQFEANNGRCAISGLWFDFDNEAKYRRRPWIPSVDRIDSTKSYTPDNCRLVCSAANYAMNEWSDSDFVKLCRGVVETLRKNIGKKPTC